MSTPERPDHPEVDRILRHAGASWRASQPAAREPDLDRLLASPGRVRRWLPVLAAASVAIVAAGIAVLQNGNGSGSDPSATTSAPATTSEQRLVVRNGDRVEVTGTVIAAPGKPVVWCPDLPQADTGSVVGMKAAPPCPGRLAVTLTGVDLERLTNPRTVQGVRTGTATLRGIWHDRTIDVQETAAPRRSAPPAPDRDQVPCAAPAAGWKAGKWGDVIIDSESLTSYVGAHPERFGNLRMAYPKGRPAGDPTKWNAVVEVFVVEVFDGDVAKARNDLERLYSGNLCVAPGDPRLRFDTDEMARANAIVQQLATDGGVFAATRVEQGKRAEIQLVVVDEQTYAALESAGLKFFDLRPEVRPV
jgi:hypothetical protein